MARTYSMDLTLKDGTEVTVDYTYVNGTHDTYMEPGDPPEAEIIKCYNDAGDVKLTDEQDEYLTEQIFEKHEPDCDDHDWPMED